MAVNELLLLSALVANLCAIFWLLGQTWQAFRRVLLGSTVTSVMLLAYLLLTGDRIGLLSILPPGVWFFPTLLLMGGKSTMVQRAFVMFLVLNISNLLHVAASFVTELFLPYGVPEFIRWRFLLTLVFYGVYVALTAWKGRGLLERLYRAGNRRIWLLNTLYTAALFYGVRMLYMPEVAPPKGVYAGRFFYALPLLAVVSLILLFVSIVRTYEKTAADFDLALARQTLVSQRAYYEHLTDALREIRTLRHDHRQQVGTLGVLLEKGDYAAARELFSGQQVRAEEMRELYCQNPIVSALLMHFANRMEEMKIRFSSSVQIGVDTSIDSYELCVVIGNLLENAFEACCKLPENRRQVSISAFDDKVKLVVEAKNSFDGRVTANENGTLISQKPGGGLGLRSIQTICSLHNGVYQPTWTQDEFTAFVVINFSKN